MYKNTLAASNLRSQRKLISRTLRPRQPCHRVCCRRLAVVALRRRNRDRNNDEWRDDGERKHERNQLAVASYLACRRIRYRAFSVILRKVSSRTTQSHDNVGCRGRQANLDDRISWSPERRGFDLSQIIGTDQGVNYTVCGQSTRGCVVITAKPGNQ